MNEEEERMGMWISEVKEEKEMGYEGQRVY